MTIREALNQTTKKLSKSTSPGLDAEVLLCFALKKSKEYLYLNPNKHLLRSMLRNYSKLVNLRARGIPVAYLTNQKDFFGLNFYVDKNVLIPRPETEGLVELVTQTIDNQKNLKILDIGTGSGNIIIALAKTISSLTPHPSTLFFASDISPTALKIAKRNAKTHQTRISFKQSDLLGAWGKQHFDVIIANLPYGWKQWKNNSSAQTVGLKFEPQQALFTQNKGLYLIEELFKQVSSLTPHPSTLFLEFDPRQTKAIKKLAKKLLPAYGIKIFKDLARKNRYAVLAKKSS